MRTYGETLGPAMEIQDPAEAATYFAALVTEMMGLDSELSRSEVETRVRGNLIYYAGYYSEVTVARVRRLFARPKDHEARPPEPIPLTSNQDPLSVDRLQIDTANRGASS